MKFTAGKTAAMIAREYGVSYPLVRWWARNNDVPSIEGDGTKKLFIFDKASEERFQNRKEYPGRKRDESITRVAEQFGVSRQCVSNWAKKNGIPKDDQGYIFGEKEIELFKHRNDNVKRGRPQKEKTEPVWKPPVLSAKGLPLGRPRKQPAPAVEAKKEKPTKEIVGRPRKVK
jgi:transposase-like protein